MFVDSHRTCGPEAHWHIPFESEDGSGQRDTVGRYDAIGEDENGAVWLSDAEYDRIRGKREVRRRLRRHGQARRQRECVHAGPRRTSMGTGATASASIALRRARLVWWSRPPVLCALPRLRTLRNMDRPCRWRGRTAFQRPHKRLFEAQPAFQDPSPLAMLEDGDSIWVGSFSGLERCATADGPGGPTSMGCQKAAGSRRSLRIVLETSG